MGGYLSFLRPAKLLVPPPPAVLLANDREAYRVRNMRPRHDSPLNVVYRIYWAIVMDDTIAMRNEIEYFWNMKDEAWKVCNIPQPPDHNAERLAIVSAIPFLLAAAFNRLIGLGLPRHAGGGILTDAQLERLSNEPKTPETVPEWCSETPPLEIPLRLPTGRIGSPESVEEEGADPFMAMKNVLVWRLHVYFS